MRTIHCDKCGNKVQGALFRVKIETYNERTDSILGQNRFVGLEDVCEACKNEIATPHWKDDVSCLD